MFFNPRLREGGDDFWGIESVAPEIFQSTPPRRRRQFFVVKTSKVIFFQSTPPRRRRQLEVSFMDDKTVFQSTPPRRRRREIRFVSPFYVLFSIHASAKEATFIVYDIKGVICFQSTPPRRRRQGLVLIIYLLCFFQSTPPRRRRHFI